MCLTVTTYIVYFITKRDVLNQYYYINKCVTFVYQMSYKHENIIKIRTAVSHLSFFITVQTAYAFVDLNSFISVTIHN